MKQLLWIGLTSAVLLAQDSQPATPFKTTVNVVVAPTIVTDRDGNFIHGLQPHDFRSEEHTSELQSPY